MDIKIYNKNFDLTQPLREYLLEKFGLLEKYQMDILGFHVELTRDQRHHKGEVYNLEVHIHLPDKKILTLKEVQDDAYAAIDILQTRIARQLVKHKAKNMSKWKRASQRIKTFKFWHKNRY